MISLRRTRALVRKEIRQIGRDPSSVLIAFVLPVILIFIFGYGVSLDSTELRLGLVADRESPEADGFAAALEGSPDISLIQGHDIRELEPLLVAERIHGIVILAPDFSEKTRQPGSSAPIQVIADGSTPQPAAFVENYVRGAWQRWIAEEGESTGSAAGSPIELEPRFWYNPTVNSRHFLIPGSIAIVLTVVGALLTALVIAREWERGTMEALLASPVSRMELLLGKVIPYFALGILSFTLCLITATALFGVPFRGSLGALYLVTALFLLGALGLGLTISAVTRNQFLASQAAINAAFLPSFMLSGFIFEIRSMPEWIQVLTQVVPARYYVNSLQTLFLAGDLWPVLLPILGALALVAALLFAALARNLKRNLE